MKNQTSFLMLLRRPFLVLMAVAVIGLVGAIFLARPALADTPIFVRPGGDDDACNGTANVDYDPTIAPACAVKTRLRASSLAGSSKTIILDNGSQTLTIHPSTASTESGDISITAVFLEVDKTDDPDPVLVGQSLTYTVQITNSEDPATGVELIDILPPVGIVLFESATPSQGNCSLGTLPPFDHILGCTLGPFAANATATVTIVVTPTAAGNIYNDASVNDQLGNSDSDDEWTRVEGVTNLSVIKSDEPDPVVLGQPLTYTLTVANNGDPAADVVLTDQLPTGVTFDSGSSSLECFNSSGRVTCNVGLLDDGEVATYTLVVTPTTFGLITNVVTVTGGDNDPDLTNNTFTETTTVIPVADLEISKSDDPDPVAPGGTLTYTLTVYNNGPGPAAGVTLFDTLPDEFGFNNASGNMLLLHLDEVTTPTFSDASGNNHNGSCNDLTGTCPTVGVSGPPGFGTALQFDGGNDFVDLGNPTGLNIEGQITIMAWISPSNISVTSGFQDIVTHGYSDPPPAAVFLRLNNDYYQVGSWDSGGNHLTSFSAAGDEGSWVHLAGVYDGNYWRLYRNGTLAASTPNPTGAVLVDFNDWFIGGRDDSGDPRAFEGLIDEVAIFDRALSAAEIAAIYDEALTGEIYLDPDQGGCGAVSGGVSCNLGDLNASDGVTVTLIGTVASDATGNIDNTVTATTTAFDPDSDNDSATESTDIQDDSSGPSTIYLPIILKNFTNPTISMYWNDWETVRDKVSPANDGAGLTPDGEPDGLFRVILNMGSQTKTVDAVIMTTSQAPGIYWDTIDNTAWVLGIFDGGTLLNNLDGTVDQTLSGVVAVTLYASDVDPTSLLYSLFPPDEYTYTVTVYFDDGSSVSASARIPPEGEPSEPPSPPPPPPPPGPSACQPIAEIAVGDEPRGVVVDETRNRVYVANYDSDSVSVIDTGSNSVLETLADINSANGITHDPDRNIIWVTNYADDEVTPIEANSDATSFTVLPAVGVGDGPWGVAYVDDYLYVANRNSNTVTVIDADDTADRTTLGGDFNQPYHIAANPNTNKVYVANFGNHTVTVINGTSVSGVINLNTGDPSTQPYGIAVDDIRNVVYVAAVNSHRIVAIDGSADAILGWATLHRGFGDPGRPVPLRVIAVNPDIGPFGDGGHIWTTTTTADGSEINQALLVPKGWGGYFHFPVPCDVGIDPSEGIAVHRSLDRAYVSSGNDTDNSPGTLNVFDDPDPAPLVPFSATDGIGIEVFRVE